MPELKRLYERYQASNELSSVMRRARSAPGRYEYIQCDINTRATIDEVIDQVLKRHGRLDMVMHGEINGLGLIVEASVKINFYGPYRVSKRCERVSKGYLLMFMSFALRFR